WPAIKIFVCLSIRYYLFRTILKFTHLLFPKLPPSALPFLAILPITVAVAITVAITIITIIASLGLDIVNDQLNGFNFIRSDEIVGYAYLLLIGIILPDEIQTAFCVTG